MKQILLMSALALALGACGPGSGYRGAAQYVGPQAAGAAENNNDSCAADPRTGGDVCSMSHEQSNSGSDAHGSDRGK
jgi:hypothetical protein